MLFIKPASSMRSYNYQIFHYKSPCPCSVYLSAPIVDNIRQLCKDDKIFELLMFYFLAFGILPQVNVAFGILPFTVTPVTIYPANFLLTVSLEATLYPFRPCNWSSVQAQIIGLISSKIETLDKNVSLKNVLLHPHFLSITMLSPLITYAFVDTF